MIAINLNDHVLVKVTPAGWAWLEAQWHIDCAKLGKALPFTPRQCHPENEQGYSKWPIWQLANAFGPQFFHGNTALPVEMNALLCNPSTTPAPAADSQG